jgi:kynurenine formamidase
MTMLTDVDIGSESVRFAEDYVGVDYHNEGHSHIDAFCHVVYDGMLYGGVPDAEVTSRGAVAGAIDLLRDGLVGRGVLLDIPGVRGVRWLEPGEHVFADDLDAAERAQGVSVEAGDVLLVRTGHAHGLTELAPWDTSKRKAGLHPSAARFLTGRRVAALGSDGNNDTAPGTTEGVAYPIHVLALNAMGSTCSTTCSSRTSSRGARRPSGGSSSSSPHRCESRAPVRPLTRSRSSDTCSSAATFEPSRATWRQKDRLTRPDRRARRSCLAGRDPVAEPSAGVGRLTRGACPQTLRRFPSDSDLDAECMWDGGRQCDLRNHHRRNEAPERPGSASGWKPRRDHGG